MKVRDDENKALIMVQRSIWDWAARVTTTVWGFLLDHLKCSTHHLSYVILSMLWAVFVSFCFFEELSGFFFDPSRCLPYRNQHLYQPTSQQSRTISNCKHSHFFPSAWSTGGYFWMKHPDINLIDNKVFVFFSPGFWCVLWIRWGRKQRQLGEQPSKSWMAPLDRRKMFVGMKFWICWKVKLFVLCCLCTDIKSPKTPALMKIVPQLVKTFQQHSQKCVKAGCVFLEWPCMGKVAGINKCGYDEP